MVVCTWQLTKQLGDSAIRGMLGLKLLFLALLRDP